MRLFETTFIVNPQADDATIDRQVRAVADVITRNDGKIIHEHRFGTRKLAYEIDKLSQGYYSQFVFEAPARALPLLDRHYKLGEEYVRYLTIRSDRSVEDFKKEVDGEESVRAGKPAPAPKEERRKEAPAEARAEAPAEASASETTESPGSEEATPTPEAETTDTPRELESGEEPEKTESGAAPSPDERPSESTDGPSAEEQEEKEL